MEPALSQLFGIEPTFFSIIKHSGASSEPAFLAQTCPFTISKSAIHRFSNRKWAKIRKNPEKSAKIGKNREINFKELKNMKKRYDKILWKIMMYQKVCVKKFEPSSMGQRFIHLLPPGPVQRHSMARLSQWSIFKRGSFIFIRRHWPGPGGRRNMMEDTSKSLNRGTTPILT